MYFKRHIFDHLEKELNNNKILILLGARRVGKTTLMHMLKEQVPCSAASLFLDLDKESNLAILNSLDSFLDYLRSEGIEIDKQKKQTYIFIDEFQHAHKSPKIFKNIYDHYPHLKIIASGSSSLDIKQLLPESLAGRKRIFEILPLTFREMLEFQNESELIDKMEKIQDLASPPQELVNKLKNKYEEYLQYGAYPEIVLKKSKEEKVQELQDIYDSYISKDIRSFLEIRNVPAYNKLIQLLALHSGQLLNVTTLADGTGLDRRTVEKYIKVLEDTFVIHSLSSFHFFNASKELIKSPKLYFFDTGLRNFAIANFLEMDKRFDKGELLETALLSEALKYKSPLERLYFWHTQSGTELDLISIREDRVRAIEIKYAKKLKNADFRGLNKFSKAFSSTTHKLEANYMLSSDPRSNSFDNIKTVFWWDYPSLFKD